MLENLHVKNLAIIDEVEVDFTQNLNILSGETGAGKSIIIGSINMALGDKIPKDIIRTNADYALVELVFSIEEESVIKQIRDMGIPLEDEQVIISRKITGSKNITRVNGEVITNAMLKKLAPMLIHIHGQHENQTLLTKKTHLEIIDRYAKDEIKPIKDSISKIYHQYLKIKKELDNAETDADKRTREISFLEYELGEIQKAKLVLGEDIHLSEQLKILSNQSKIISGLSEVYGYTAESGSTASDQITRALKILHKIQDLDPELEGMSNQLLDIENLLTDFNKDVSGYISEADNKEEELEEVRERLNLIHTLKTKYGKSIENILEYYNDGMDKLEKYQNYDEYIDQLKEEMSTLEQELEKLSLKLSQIRMNRADILCKDIRKALMDLNFIDVRFDMIFDKMDHFTENGYDDGEFMISTNPGESMKPIAKIASGGELSRIMLALKSVMADNDGIDTMIFDEIDSGISGRTAQMVSEKLSYIAKKRQVICITHLPQIAAMADSHFVIEKKSDGSSTSTNIRKLSRDESVEEIARIIGGAQITEAVLFNAKEMIHLAKQIEL